MANHLAQMGFSVLAFDHLGAGQTAWEEGFSSEDMAWVPKVLGDHLGIRESHLVGFSMGGVLAQMGARLYPQFVKSLTLIGTFFDRDFMPKSPRDWPNTEEAMVEKMGTYVSRVFFEKNPLLMKSMAKQLLAQAQGPENRGAQLQTRAMAATDLGLYTKNPLSLPVFLIHGREDQIVPIGALTSMEALYPNHQVFIYEDGGHLLLAEKTKDLYGRVATFIRGLD